jgi:ankyrin repeat protein
MASSSFVVPVIPEVDTTSAFFVFERAEAPPKVNDVDADGKTALWKAAEAGNLGVVGKLMGEYGDRLDVNRGDKEGFTPLAIAVQRGHVNVVKLLLTANTIKVNQSVQKGREAASTPLYIACATFTEASEATYTEIVRVLLDDPSTNVNLPNHQGETPIFAAALCCSLEVVQMLCGNKTIDLNKVDNYKSTPLLAASRSGREEIVQYLLSEHGNAMKECINAEDCYGHSPLKRAVAFGYDKIAKLLQDAGASN